ncbi:ribonuclease R [Thauera aromatica]|uniref:Ribonuclease R n=1 Tax=Thauera aromatica K172 TaxID=44139 RepID=A0A2R4BL52_THAAR|nr:ribonuclease R [Thauera aromatica]AVR87944.1 3'-to-5' exoribonuclease RNase R [Thauera aromatica K172]
MTRKTKKTTSRRGTTQAGAAARTNSTHHSEKARKSAGDGHRAATAAPSAVAEAAKGAAKAAVKGPGRSRAARKAAAAQASAIRLADPHYLRESQQYEHPLPSREYVLQILAERGVPMPFAELVAALDIAPHELDFFDRRLRAMERDGQIIRNRRDAYLLPSKVDLIKGRVEGHPDGFGFLRRDDGEPDVFLGPKEMREVLHGDRVIVRISGTDRRGRPEGKLVEVLERANTRVVGRVINEHGVMIVVPENRRLAQDILVAPGGRKKPEPGQIVTVELVEQPTKFAQPIGRIVEVLGNYADPGMEIEIALRKHDLPFEFSSEAKAQTRKLPDKVRKKDWAGREDLTGLPLVTIDGETAKDFDDAVYCERQGKGYRLVVAIADVSHYVDAASALDQDAFDRGNSVYFPRRVIPMLPEKLSNGLCSLNPQVERLAMVADIDISATGAVKQYRFYPAVIWSHARLTYTRVAAALYDKDAAARTELAALLPHLENLDQLFRVLLKARAKRGAIDFETTETRMIFDDQGKIAQIVPEVRNDAHRLIEECMLAANVCASDFLATREHPALYRVHDSPSEDKLAKLREFLKEFGLGLGGGDEPRASDFAKLLEQVKDRPDAQLLQTVMLRSLKQAMYSPDNVGHFGLAYESYTHFTSPIRRYPDLLIHRGIKAALGGEQYRPGDWEQIGLHCSMTERRADEATRDVVAFLKCYFMQDRVGEEFTGSVSAVVPFGLFVALDDIFIEGLLHISDLGSDYFHHDETRHALVGERTGKQFRLSDRVKVQLVRVDMATNKIDFRLIEGPLPAQPKAPAKAAEAAPVAIQPEAGKKAAKPRTKKAAAAPAVEAVPAPAVPLPLAAPVASETSAPKPGKARAKKAAVKAVAESAPAAAIEAPVAAPAAAAEVAEPKTRSKRAKKAAVEAVTTAAPAPLAAPPVAAEPKPRTKRATKPAAAPAVEIAAAAPVVTEAKARKARTKKTVAEPAAVAPAPVEAPPAAAAKPRTPRVKKAAAAPAAEALESAPPTSTPARRAGRKTSAKGTDRG